MSGFSLVELMVAMVIGMLGLIVMMQVFSMFESQKRTTTSGDDSISSGAMSLYGIQRDIQQSGWGISNVQLIGCRVSGLFAWDLALAIPMVPVTIYPSQGATISTPAGYPVIPDPDPNTDVVLIVGGNGNATAEGNHIDFMPGANTYAVYGAADFSFVPPDHVVGVPKARPNPCVLASSTVNAAVAGPNVTVAAAFAGIAKDDRLFNLGRTPFVRAYAIRNGNLTVCDFMTTDCRVDTTGMAAAAADAIWAPIANNVVSLRAEYGRNQLNSAGPPLPAMTGFVDTWDQTVPLPASLDPLRNTQACGLLRVAAVRLALVARSSQPERTLDWPSLTNRVMTPLLLNPALDPRLWIGNAAINLPDPDPTWPTWQDFRYKVFQTVIPLRNVTSQGPVPEC